MILLLNYLFPIVGAITVFTAVIALVKDRTDIALWASGIGAVLMIAIMAANPGYTPKGEIMRHGVPQFERSESEIRDRARAPRFDAVESEARLRERLDAVERARKASNDNG